MLITFCRTVMRMRGLKIRINEKEIHYKLISGLGKIEEVGQKIHKYSLGVVVSALDSEQHALKRNLHRRK